MLLNSLLSQDANLYDGWGKWGDIFWYVFFEGSMIRRKMDSFRNQTRNCDAAVDKRISSSSSGVDLFAPKTKYSTFRRHRRRWILIFELRAFIKLEIELGMVRTLKNLPLSSNNSKISNSSLCKALLVQGLSLKSFEKACWVRMNWGTSTARSNVLEVGA